MLWPLPLLWVVGTVAAYLYCQLKNIPWTTAAPVLPAFLLEVTFFYVLAVEKLRFRLERQGPVRIACTLTAAGVLPYLVASIATGTFHWDSALWVTALAAAVAFWYVLLPPQPGSDILLLFLLAVVWATRMFSHLYVSPHPKIPMEMLGRLMWLRTALFALLAVRRVKGIGFGFWPRQRDWLIGVVHFLLLLPVVAGVAWMIHFGSPHWPTGGFQKSALVGIGTFFGFLWVIALAEEFLFRGMLLQWFTVWFRSWVVALIVTSMLFGAVHIWYGHFPNWKLATLAAVAGLFYGLAFRRAQSIRASMVTHALTVTAWRLLYS